MIFWSFFMEQRWSLKNFTLCGIWDQRGSCKSIRVQEKWGVYLFIALLVSLACVSGIKGHFEAIFWGQWQRVNLMNFTFCGFSWDHRGSSNCAAPSWFCHPGWRSHPVELRGARSTDQRCWRGRTKVWARGGSFSAWSASWTDSVPSRPTVWTTIWRFLGAWTPSGNLSSEPCWSYLEPSPRRT